jgi:environmental stress-induced protein Ves
VSAARIIRAADCPEIPWKNGGGTTREIAIFPPGAGIDDFLWRLSMARVEKAGAFSPFTGVDRVLAVLDGTLRLSGPTLDARLDSGSTPLAFDGGAPVIGEPLAGPVVDLNAMARRGRYRVAMQRLPAGARLIGSEATFVLALEPQPARKDMVDRFDCLRIDAPTTLGGTALLVRFSSR